MKTRWTLAALGALFLAGCGGGNPPAAQKKKAKMDENIDNYNTWLKKAEGTYKEPEVKLTSDEQRVRAEVAEMQKIKLAPLDPAMHPLALTEPKRGDWATYKHSDGRIEKRTVMTRHSTCALLAIEDKNSALKGEVELVFNKPYDPTLLQPQNAGAVGQAVYQKLASGEETVQVAGKDYKTQWTEYKVLDFYSTGVHYLKLWMSYDVKLVMVKAIHDYNADPKLKMEDRVKLRETIELVDFGEAPPPAPPVARPQPAAKPAVESPKPASPPPAVSKPAESKVAPPAPAVAQKTVEEPKPPPASKKTAKVYVLKDGQRIVAQSVMALEDSYAIKDTGGKMHSIKKADVAEITQQEAAVEAPAKPAETVEAPKPATPPKPAETKPAAETPKGKKVTTYLLKDGRRITALMVVDLGKQLSIKDETGKFVVIEKADVMETEVK